MADWFFFPPPDPAEGLAREAESGPNGAESVRFFFNFLTKSIGFGSFWPKLRSGGVGSGRLVFRQVSGSFLLPPCSNSLWPACLVACSCSCHPRPILFWGLRPQAGRHQTPAHRLQTAVVVAFLRFCSPKVALPRNPAFSDS